MKVLIITNSVSDKSGWGRYSRAIIDEFDKLGVVYKVVVDEATDDRIQPAYIMKKNNNIFNFIINIFSIRRLAKDFDIVHAFDVWPYAVFGLAAVWQRRKKLFINGIGTYSVEPFNHKVKRYLMAMSYKRAQMVFCISEYTKNKILKKIKLSQIMVVHLGTTTFMPLAQSELDQLKDKFAIKDSYPIILTVGQIKERKGQFYTVAAMAKLIRDYPQLRYYMLGSAGDSAYEEKIKNFCSANHLTDNVFILHAVADDTLTFFYQVADVFALNSVSQGDFFEGFGLVILEAGQFGVPAIGSKNSGIEDAISDNYSGYLTEAMNPQDIYEKLKKLLAGDKQQWAKQAKTFANNFTWEKTVKTYVEYYQKN